MEGLGGADGEYIIKAEEKDVNLNLSWLLQIFFFFFLDLSV